MVKLQRSFDAAMGPSTGTEGVPQETFAVPLSMSTPSAGMNYNALTV